MNCIEKEGVLFFSDNNYEKAILDIVVSSSKSKMFFE